jgi:hypothetical protein
MRWFGKNVLSHENPFVVGVEIVSSQQAASDSADLVAGLREPP